MEELLYEEKTLLTYEEEVLRFFFWRILRTKRLTFYIYFIIIHRRKSL